MHIILVSSREIVCNKFPFIPSWYTVGKVIVIQNGENFDSRVLVDIIINLVPRALFRQAKAPWGRG